MKIGIDARFLGPESKGLGRYTQKLVEHLEKIDHENQYIIFLRKDNYDLFQPTNPNFKKILADYKWYTFAEQIFMPLLLHKHKFDFVHFPHFNIPIFYLGKFIITIHDLILVRFPTKKATTLNKFFYTIKFLVYKLTIFLAVKRAMKIIAVSQFTKQDICQYYNLPSEKIFVTHEAVDNEKNIKKDEICAGDEVAKKTELDKFLIYVGNAYPHKNLEKLVEAFGVWKKKTNHSHKLVLVGKDDYFYQKLKEYIKNKDIKDVIIFDTLSDRILYNLYAKASAFIFLSLYEGFGLPPLEAMQEGIPVLSSDHPVMLEILGESALHCDGENIDNIVRGMKRIVGDQNLRKELIAKGRIQANKYSWEKMAKETFEVYDSVNGNR
ncbi:MAG: glycosyltransferase family 4 protein [Candidatus Moranbacteria bacterium]|nr:glycosyltransferase family 4 protein [Candidatus Moranbacteria bacterium]